MNRLDASAARALENAQTVAPWTTPRALRADYLASFAATQRPLEPVAEAVTHHDGALRLRIWRGQKADPQNAPALLYLHGGGWMIGAPETHEDICRILANRADAVVISPDYRLAPEAPFPAALEDSLQALHWIANAAPDLGIDPSRIAVGGDSAGGNLAAVLALMARDGDAPKLSAQLLIYPVTDQSHTHASFHDYARGFGLTAEDMARFRDAYLPDPATRHDWRAAPLRVTSTQDLAPASIVLAGHDVLWGEGRAYADRLGAQARVHDWPGQIHGFVSQGGIIPEAADALAALVADWKAFDHR